MGVHSRRKIFSTDGYKELYAKEAATKRGGKIPARYTRNAKKLQKLMVADRKRRKVSDRAAKLIVPKATGH